MFGRSKKPAVSASRFCRSAVELPYAQLYRYGEFVVAVSKLTMARRWPPSRLSLSDNAIGYGLLHGSHTYPDHGAVEPLLPVQVRFERTSVEESDFGAAWFNRSTEDGTYVLEVTISDPDGRIVESFDAAMSRAILSGYDFVHLHCMKERDPLAERRTDYAAQRKEEIAFLKQVEAGEADLGTVSFDKVYFDDALVTKAPAWSWAWNDWDFDKPRFKDRKTARWRQEWLPHR